MNVKARDKQFLGLVERLQACRHLASSNTVFRLNDDCPECRAFNVMKMREISRAAFTQPCVSIEHVCGLPPKLSGRGPTEQAERDDRAQDYPKGGMQ